MGILFKNTVAPLSVLNVAGFSQQEDAIKFVENHFSPQNLPMPSPFAILGNNGEFVEYKDDTWMVIYAPTLTPELKFLTIIKCFHDLKIQIESLGEQIFLNPKLS